MSEDDENDSDEKKSKVDKNKNQKRKYTRKNGSFDLIELETKESEKVIIRVW